ncbi:MAG: hypothetical protein IT189_10730 [Microbacteriaceae bacterium]|nr:hypothetical protein [Microbacteriaceae bacterium]
MPEHLSIGVIVWFDWDRDDPTVIAEQDPTTLARAMALLIHQRISNDRAYGSLAGLLTAQPPPQDWLEPQDVDDWLEALREAAPFPAFSFHEVPVAGGADGTDRASAVRMLALALEHRDRELGAPAPVHRGEAGGDRPGPDLMR